MQRQAVVTVLLYNFKQTKGIVAACPLLNEDRGLILDIEQDAEKRPLMGLGKVVNTGVVEVLKRELVFVALTDMDFDWGRHPSLLLKKCDEVVGEEVRDREVGERLALQRNVWFLHKGFAIYKDRISFPQDIVKNICHFEIPYLPAEWCMVDAAELQCEPIIYANPATPADLFLKERYFEGRDEKGLGTILVGVIFQCAREGGRT